MQDCYLRLLERAGRYDLPRDGIKILLRAVTNASIDRRSRERTLLSLDGGEEVGRDLTDRRSSCPLQQAMGSELAARIEAALERLPVGQRAALHLSGLGYTLPEVAEFLETSHANARVLVHRARRALEEILGPFLYGGEP